MLNPKTGKPYSRGRLYQLRHKAAKLCIKCSKPAVLWCRCSKHQKMERKYYKSSQRRKHLSAEQLSGVPGIV